MGALKSNTVFRANDLKPVISIRFNLIHFILHFFAYFYKEKRTVK